MKNPNNNLFFFKENIIFAAKLGEMEENQHLQLSIIVPVYNVEDYIRPCIESIFLKIRNYTVWRTLYRRDFLSYYNISFYPGICCQDKPFTHEIYIKAKTCIKAAWPIYIYRRHQQSVSYRMSERLAKDICKVIDIWLLQCCQTGEFMNIRA